MKNIAILGFGTVGSALYNVLKERKSEIERLVGKEFKVKTVMVKNLEKKREIESTTTITDDFDDILQDDEIDIVIELTGAFEEGFHFIKSSLENGKDVITGSKSVISYYFEELHEIANREGRVLLYEAAVAGGIPIIEPLREQTLLNDIYEIEGILNGTCNYILTRMFDEGLAYDRVLKDAQDLGYAEAEPSEDVDGFDTQRKLNILNTISYTSYFDEDDIYTVGISNISEADVEYIKKLDYRVKLIGRSQIYDDGYISMVEPTMVENSSYFSTVNMAFNSVAIEGSNVGELKFYGAGAGGRPTGNAVASDLIEILVGKGKTFELFEKKEYKNKNDIVKSNYYLRITGHDDICERILDEEKIFKNDKKGLDNFIIIEDVNRIKLEELLKSEGLKAEEYFMAKIS